MEVTTNSDSTIHFSTVSMGKNLPRGNCGKHCVVILWTWAASLSDVIKIMPDLVTQVEPDVIFTTWMSDTYEGNPKSPLWSMMMRSIEKFLVYRYHI
jgi:hypothetical protein